MRLICPNCNAEYEIPDDAIPANGRDLQCSSCGETWFFKPPETDLEIAGDLSQMLASQLPSDAPNTAGASDAAPSIAPGTDLPPLDTAVADVLRQEAAAEVRLRSQDTGGSLESQPDLGLETAGQLNTQQRHARESRDRLERMRSVGEQVDPAASANHSQVAPMGEKAHPALPDADTLGSSLRAPDSTDEAADGAVPAFYNQAGFFSGFLFTLIIAALLAGVYLKANYIAQMAPDLSAPLNQYQEAVDIARLWLDQQAEQAIALFKR